jgi:hypothetical protein
MLPSAVDAKAHGLGIDAAACLADIAAIDAAAGATAGATAPAISKPLSISRI